ncbi:MAG: NAD(P)H-dependent oxidoreductase [Pseudomonadota bacterium]
MKTLAFVASNSRNSINRMLLDHAVRLLQSEIMETDVETLSVRDFDVPIYSIDIENESGIPQPARDLFEKIGAADQLLFAYAEHNGSYTAGYKSLFDWMSRIDMKVFQGKPMLAIATSPGGGGAGSVLAQVEASATYFAADMKAVLSIPKFYDVFDSDAGEIKDEALRKSLLDALAALKT